jgi:hypothetical protein
MHLHLLKLILSQFEISDLERLNIRQKAVYERDQLQLLAKELDKILKKKNQQDKKLGSPEEKNNKFSEQLQPREKFSHPMIRFDCLSQSGENNDQQQQQEVSWADFFGQIFP